MIPTGVGSLYRFLQLPLAEGHSPSVKADVFDQDSRTRSRIAQQFVEQYVDRAIGKRGGLYTTKQH